MNSGTKNTIMIMIAVLVMLGGYWYVKKDSADTTGTGIKKVSKSVANNEILILLSQMKNLKIDRDFFTAQTFTGLEDFGVTLIKQPAGRNNPFAPLGFEAPVSGGNISTSTRR